ncbi:MAG: flippase activity-associated protein Agl23, partial [Candidatus Binatia bacterium]
MDLDRPVGRFRLEHVVHGLILLTALALRLLWLGERPLHHDESIHAYYSWRILTKGPADYRYDPVYHGPSLYYLTAVFHGLFGPSDFSSRLLPLVCSVGLVGLAWPLRTLIGRREAIAYALLVTFSPTLAYYGRSLRHDVPMVFFTFAAILAFLVHLRDRKPHLLYLAGALAGLAAATKEDVYLAGFVLANTAWIIGLWTGDGAGVGRRFADWLREAGRFLVERKTALATSLLIALTTVAVLYTSLLTHPENWNPVGRAIRHWWAQHQIERIGGTRWYYLPFELVYEPLIFFPALVTLALWIGHAPASR